ncbi:alpha/beta hydrolase [Solihabitans fulvus]|uniref:Alpha/beta hydrolase n=1 Tax=Solihabitans fulvus TaxID=1892852 RepID=A0A5B2XUN7_9PSEU|nr:alpha/beta hydrolase [Solihabitans fulvus]KAA2266589.1 alpha/beta hydrolase [Solihabitans fulvus]
MTRPTVVLVHGGLSDASSWDAVVAGLLRDGHTVLAPPNPLRGQDNDAAYVASVLRTVPGPVVLVGHSYGGAVITNAGREPNVRALVYLAAMGPAEGENAQDAVGDHPGGVPEEAIVTRPFPLPDGGTGVDVYLDQARFHDVLAHDVPAERAAVLAVTQRPLAMATQSDRSGPPAWASLPSWYLVAAGDRALPPGAQRAMAAKMGADTIELDTSHLPHVSRPDAVADLIRAAVRAVA